MQTKVKHFLIFLAIIFGIIIMSLPLFLANIRDYADTVFDSAFGPLIFSITPLIIIAIIPATLIVLKQRRQHWFDKILEEKGYSISTDHEKITGQLRDSYSSLLNITVGKLYKGKIHSKECYFFDLLISSIGSTVNPRHAFYGHHSHLYLDIQENIPDFLIAKKNVINSLKENKINTEELTNLNLYGQPNCKTILSTEMIQHLNTMPFNIAIEKKGARLSVYLPNKMIQPSEIDPFFEWSETFIQHLERIFK